MQKIQDKKTNSLDEVKEIYENGEYFSDAYSWYCERFLSPYSERVFLFFISIFSFAIILFVISIVIKLFPLKESFPVLVHQKDSFLYVPVIKKLKPKGIDYTSNQSLARYLAIQYIKSLFNNDFSDGNLNVLKSKLEKIANLSDKQTYEKAKIYLNNLFKNGVYQKVSINSLEFVNDSKDIYNFDRRNYKIEFICTFYTFGNNEEIEKKERKILLTFKFSNIIYKDNVGGFEPITFTVNDFNIKNK